MENKKLERRNERPKLVELVKKWKLNKKAIAEQAGIKHSDFQNKFYQTLPSYFFTDEEYEKIVDAINVMMLDMRRFTLEPDKVKIKKTKLRKV